ncbi:TIGR03503 family protein [Vibrio sp.]|nr:TIGR03503 family protein [Vibrio sp.]
MLRVSLLFLTLVFSSFGGAAVETSMSLLDNRFRVDSSISHVTFVIYRDKDSSSVILVRPDGKKFYIDRKPDTIKWYQEADMDIIMIEKPMAGPWQAIGSITPKNKIILLSDVLLTSDPLPRRLFRGEEVKFTARILSDSRLVVLRDFLDSVKLTVTFTRILENPNKEAEPSISEIVGEFKDDGQELDEKAGDGIFTVKLPITSEPGKYSVQIKSSNEVFLRAQEQEVLIYPNPLNVVFEQSRDGSIPHRIHAFSEELAIKAGSMAAHVELQNPDGTMVYFEQVAQSNEREVWLKLPARQDTGKYLWEGVVYADDDDRDTSVILPITKRGFNVVNGLSPQEKLARQQLAEQVYQEEKAKELEIQQAREEQRTTSLLIIIVGNLFILLIAGGIFMWWRMKNSKPPANVEEDEPKVSTGTELEIPTVRAND